MIGQLCNEFRTTSVCNQNWSLDHDCITIRAMTSELIRSLVMTMAWPAAAVVSLSVAVGGRDVSGWGLVLAASGSAAAYGLDRLIDRRRLDPADLRRALMICVVIASLVTALLACTAWWRFQVCLLLSLVAGAYVPLKKVVPKNVLTTVAWTAAVALLPFHDLPVFDLTFRFSLLAVALIMASDTILCDLPDVAADRKSGVLGIAPQLGVRAGAIAAVLFGVSGTFVAGSVGRYGLAITAASLALLAVLLARHPSHYRYRLWADALVTFIPGPVALLFR
jgi:hypothetical protein